MIKRDRDYYARPLICDVGHVTFVFLNRGDRIANICCPEEVNGATCMLPVNAARRCNPPGRQVLHADPLGFFRKADGTGPIGYRDTRVGE